MKYFILIAAIITVFNGCSSKTETGATSNGVNPPTTESNTANANSLTATNSNPPGMQPYNGVQNVNPNAFNASNDNLKVIPYQQKKDDLPVGSRIAPDDSIINSGSRGKEFFETRTFNSHPTIAKVEKLMDGKTTKYKVYLKNGKVVEAPADKMKDFAAMAPENILDAIGMLPKPQSIPPLNSEQKKDQKP